MKKAYIISLALVVTFTSISFLNTSKDVYACSPPGPGPYPTTTPQQFKDNATAVFAGTVTSVQKHYKADMNYNYVASSTVTFEVSAYWKGDVTKTVKVVSYEGSASCIFFFDFIVGEDYLVYARRDSNKNELIAQDVGWGNKGTQKFADATEHIAALGAAKAPSDVMIPKPITINPYTFSRNLTVGSRGADVIALQVYLEGQGYFVMPKGVAKGYFGPATRTAVAKYQISQGISPAFGYFGPITRMSMNSRIIQ